MPDGKIVTLIGANGAGKSTTLRDHHRPGKGPVRLHPVERQELLGKAIDQVISSGIAMSPEGRRVFADLTVLENLKIGAYLRKDKAEIEKDLQWVYSCSPPAQERSWQAAGTLSGGEQQMLAVGRAPHEPSQADDAGRALPGPLPPWWCRTSSRSSRPSTKTA